MTRSEPVLQQIDKINYGKPHRFTKVSVQQYTASS